MIDTPHLTLYITGRTHRSQRAIDNLRWLCDVALRGRCDYQIIDLLEQPDIAAQERIMATPTLVRVNPGPTRRIVGDLSDATKVIRSLELSAYA